MLSGHNTGNPRNTGLSWCSQTNVGSGSNTVSSLTILDADDQDVTSSFTDVRIRNGELTVFPRTLTITTGSASKAYDGTALTELEATIEGLANGETATVTATGTQTAAGESTNPYSIAWGSANPENYTVSESLGTLTVTPAAVTITTGSASKAYDGTALTAEAKIEGLANGETAAVTATGTQTAAGKSTNPYSIAWGSANPDNYTVSESLGTLKVTPRVINVQVPLDDGKMYMDYTGQALYYTEYVIPDGSFAEGDLASGYVTSDQIEEGEGTLKFVVDKKTDSMNLNNYIFVVEGSLVVEVPIAVNPDQ